LQAFEFPEGTRTAADAASAIGCDVAQIVKSLVFRTVQTGRAVMVLTSGVNRVDEGLISNLLGEALGKADAAFVRKSTGYAIGGVPPIGHANDLSLFIDEDLFLHTVLWAAAGTPNAVFKLTPDELLAATQGIVKKVSAEEKK
jgi:prolyl-tRNA editing enzyme YbaK/EbsC (Cys-tRNA(Pro) deacylase)